MTEWLFSTPWWLPTAIVAVGVMVWVSGNKRVDATLKRVGLAIAAVGVLWGLVSYLVKTDLERVTEGSERLVRSAVEQDWATFESLLHPKAVAVLMGSRLPATGPRELTEMAKRRTRDVGLTSATTGRVEAERRPPMLMTSFRLFAQVDKLAGQIIPSTWQLDWEKTDQGWRIIELRAISIGNTGGEDAKANLGR